MTFRVSIGVLSVISALSLSLVRVEASPGATDGCQMRPSDSSSEGSAYPTGRAYDQQCSALIQRQGGAVESAERNAVLLPGLFVSDPAQGATSTQEHSPNCLLQPSGPPPRALQWVHQRRNGLRCWRLVHKPTFVAKRTPSKADEPSISNDAASSAFESPPAVAVDLPETLLGPTVASTPASEPLTGQGTVDSSLADDPIATFQARWVFDESQSKPADTQMIGVIDPGSRPGGVTTSSYGMIVASGLFYFPGHERAAHLMWLATVVALIAILAIHGLIGGAIVCIGRTRPAKRQPLVAPGISEILDRLAEDEDDEEHLRSARAP